MTRESCVRDAENKAEDKGGRLRVVVSVIAVVLMAIFIFVMSATPSDDSDAMSLGVAWRIVSFVIPGYDQLPLSDQLHWQELLNYPIRKTAHFLEYAAFGALCMNMLVQLARNRACDAPSMRRLAVGAWALGALYAATDEFHQLFVSGRSGMVTDVMLDSAGVLTGVLLCWLLFAMLAKKNHQP